MYEKLSKRSIIGLTLLSLCRVGTAQDTVDCKCPAKKVTEQVGTATVHPANLIPGFGDPDVTSGTSGLNTTTGEIDCVINTRDVGRGPGACSWRFSKVNSAWVWGGPKSTNGGCPVAGNPTRPNWCQGGASTLPPAAQSALDAEMSAKAAATCACPVQDQRCEGNCASDPANPPKNVPQKVNGSTQPTSRRDKKLEISVDPATGDANIKSTEDWEAHCTGTCAQKTDPEPVE